MQELFNNREIAVGVWLVVFLVFAYKKAGREPFVDVLKHALTPKILVPLILSFTPTALVVAILASFGLWDLSVLKETIYWAVGTGLVMFGRFTEVKGAKELYRHTVKDTLKVIIILEFLVWFYVFPLWVELLLVPFTTLVVVLAIFAEHMKVEGAELTKKGTEWGAGSCRVGNFVVCIYCFHQQSATTLHISKFRAILVAYCAVVYLYPIGLLSGTI